MFASVFVSAILLTFSAVQGQTKVSSVSKVQIITRDTFDAFIKKNPLVLIEWYTPWCEHCQELSPKLQAAAVQLAEMKKNKEIPISVRIAKMDNGDEYNAAAQYGRKDLYNFTSYPTMITFTNGTLNNKYEPFDGKYYGGREVDDIVFWMSSLAKGLNPIEEERKNRPGLYRTKTTAMPDLSPETFNATVKRTCAEGNNAVWVIKFYSDRCPYCRSMSPELVKAAEDLTAQEPRAIVGAINSRIYHEVAEENGVTGYPWVAAFYDGKKIEDMAGLGGSQSIVDFGKRKVAEVFDASKGPAPQRIPIVYDETGMLVMHPDLVSWAKVDSAKWTAIEEEKKKAAAAQAAAEAAQDAAEAAEDAKAEAGGAKGFNMGEL